MPVAEGLTLGELVPKETLASLQQQFEAVTGVRMVFTDADGRPVTDVDEPLAFCGSLVRTGDGSTVCLRRAKWDVPETGIEEGIRRKHSETEPIPHRCRGGFRDTAAPIVVEGQTIGNVVFGRTLTSEPDIERFRQLATEGGMKPELGEQVARKALVMPKERVAAIAGLIRTLANLLANAAYDTLRAQRIIELEGLRDSLIHMIVHDLRTPLTSIIGSLETVEQQGYDRDTTEAVAPLALNSAQELLEMVNTLLDINKMESGEMKLDLADVDFPAVARDAASQVQGLLEEYGHELQLDLEVEGSLRADPDLLRRVVVNLLGNAIKFTPQGGHITLAARTDEQGLTFSVADDGPGIPPEDQGRIFEKFGQAQARQEGHKHSTGLGLTFCQMVAEAHGGRVWLESEVGKGSTFYVLIPRK
jgi:signal transduction histidine kinase